MRTAMQPVNNPAVRHATKRRGTIIILAVGVLAVLSVAALSYMTVVKLDRSSANAYATISNFRQQVNVTTSHIGSLLTADLFGNKIVSASTPRIDGAGNRIWPKMFEDGEYSDYPSVDTGWLADPPDPDQRLYMDITGAASKRDRDELTPNDDAWLASQQPVDIDSVDGWDTWPQITNMRSGWVWQFDQSQGSDGFWRRDHGRYVDIAEWLARSQGNPAMFQRGDPGLDISNFNTSIAGYSGGYDEDNGDGAAPPPPLSGPNLGVDGAYLASGGPTLGTNLRVFDMQMSRMQEVLESSGNLEDVDTPPADFTSLSSLDGRLWADTDGDGRADARWQQLDSHGELFGFKWVVAARIIDSSAKISANSSFEWQIPGDSDNVGYGRTPADIDLYRLLRRSKGEAIGSVGHPDVRMNGTLIPANHYDFYRSAQAWNLEAAFGAINNNFSSEVGWVDLPHDGMSGATSLLEMLTPLDPREREMLWRTVGSAPRLRTTAEAVPMPIADEIDLRSFEGANHGLLVSKLEQRTDQVLNGGTPLGYLPGMDSLGGGMIAYPDMESLGPLRALEDRRVVQTYGLGAETPEMDFGSNGYFQVNKLERLQTDIRRHLTMINGVADFSPVPVVNTAATYDDQFLNRKIRIDDPSAIRLPVSAPDDLDNNAITLQVRDFVQRAYESFMWALAPLASEVPVASGLTSNDVGMMAVDQSYHYGGSDLGATSPAGAQPGVNVSYAALRAASLAINLADAMDHDENFRESPTLARFTPTPDASVVTALDNREVKVTPTFVHGNVPQASFNAAETGAPANGVTLVGLDRQPFLRQAFYLELFEDFQATSMPTGELNGLIVVDPGDASDQVGSLFAVELGNPWAEEIDVQDYVIRISKGNVTDQFVAPIVPISGGSTIIGPNDTKTFFMLFETGREPIFDAVWDEFLNGSGGVYEEFANKGLDIATGNLVQLDSANPDVILPTGAGPVPFTAFGTDSLPVQLIYRYPGSTQLDVLVDRLSPQSGVQFPVPDILGMLDPVPVDTGGTPVNSRRGSARFARSSSVARPLGQGSTGFGFPSYVIERQSENDVETSDFKTQSWRLFPLLETQDSITDPVLTDLVADLFAIQTPGDDVGMLTMLPSFQLFVPNGPLRSVAELHMLSVFTHRYINNASIYEASDPTLPGYSLFQAHMPPGQMNPSANFGMSNRWITISEQLGQDIHYNYNASAGLIGNPYLGVLDPSRYILGDDLADMTPSGMEWPDSLRIPLANRVFDCFSVLPTSRHLAQGKINLNTAPIEVLESMPFFAPEDDVNGSMPGATALPASSGPGASRSDLVKAYRDLDGVDRSNDFMSGLRDSMDPITTNAHRGLVNIGELLAMSDWTTTTDGNPSALAGFDDFMELGIDGGPGNDGAPLSLRYTTPVNGLVVTNDFNELGSYSGRNDYALATFDPVDDPEERLALARSALDIAAVRSDVFTAWFVIRAYDPEQIEAIQAPEALGFAVRAEQMNQGAGATNSPGLKPAYETRWLVVFDRSQVRRPNERPRILLQVELPID